MAQVPPLRFNATKLTPYLSVECGAIDAGEARARLGWQPAPLAERVEETVGWWVRSHRERFEAARAAAKRGRECDEPEADDPE